jgi:glutaconate CoA-transferase subunit A
MGSDLPRVNPLIKTVACPFTGEQLAAVPALNPHVAIVHAQRADENGNAQIWGLLGVQKEAAFASKHVIIVAEEIVTESVIRSDPNRTLIPGLIVDAVVHEPFGCHPSYAQGFYDRDNDFYVSWRDISQNESRFNSYLDEWVFGVTDRAEYVARLGDAFSRLKAKPAFCEGVNYGY